MPLSLRQGLEIRLEGVAARHPAARPGVAPALLPT
jgi:hypothetical protein